MPHNTTNRFAVLTPPGRNRNRNKNKSSASSQAPSEEDSFADQVDDDGSQWKEVKRARPRRRSQPLGQNPPTLVIRGTGAPPSVRTRDKQRDVSGSTQETGPIFEDPHEFWCGVCSRKFCNKVALQSHIRAAPGDHSNYCNLCKRVFKDRNGLKNHVDNSQGHEVHCNLCLSAFKDDWALKCHFENNRSAGHQWVCMTCLVGFRAPHELKRHYQTAKNHVMCKTCHRTFRDQDERDAHWRNTSKHRHCLQPGCDFDAPTAYLLEKHLSDDHFRCVGCKAVLPSQTKLTQHYDTCKAEVTCPGCDLRFAGQRALVPHSESCLGARDEEEVNGRHTEIDSSNAEFFSAASVATTYASATTTHVSTSRGCFSCSAVLPSYTAMVAHLERGACPSLPDPTDLILCLGKWWYSTLYMDLDLHAQIRRNEIDLQEITTWMDQGNLRPFICRSDACDRMTFAHFSELVAHIENGSCDWDIAKLHLSQLGEELDALLKRRESAVN